MDGLSPATASKVNAASYADTAEGGKEQGSSSGTPSSSKSGAASASRSAPAGTGK